VVTIANTNSYPVTITAVNLPTSSTQAGGFTTSALSTAQTGCSATASSVTWNFVSMPALTGMTATGGAATTLQTTVATTTWTSAALATGSYWYEVVTDIATNWAGAKSAATTQRTISSSACS